MSVDTSTSTPHRIIVFRHAEREDHIDHAWERNAARPHDPPLSVEGLRQSRALGEAFAEYIAMQGVPRDELVAYTSPYMRCVTTLAVCFQKAFGDEPAVPLCVEDLFSENAPNAQRRLMGAHKHASSGRVRTLPKPVMLEPGDLVHLYPWIDPGYACVHPITYDDDGWQLPTRELGTRLHRGLPAFLRLPAHAGKTAVVATHGGVARELLGVLQDEPLGYLPAYAHLHVVEWCAARKQYVLVHSWKPEGVADGI